MTDPAAAPVVATSPDTYQPRMFQWRGRIGRLRFLAYLFGLTFVTTFPPMFFMYLLARQDSAAFFGVQALATAATVVVPVLVGWRRLNDMGYRGWQALGLLIPLANAVVFLWIVCARGDAGPNRYGPAPGPNTPAIVAAALGLVALAVIGTIAVVVHGPYSGPNPGYQQRSAPAGQVL